MDYFRGFGSVRIALPQASFLRRTPLLQLSPVLTFLRLNKLGCFGFEFFFRERQAEREREEKT